MWIYILTGIPVFFYLLWKLLRAYLNGNNDYWTKRGVPRALTSDFPGAWKAMLGLSLIICYLLFVGNHVFSRRCVFY